MTVWLSGALEDLCEIEYGTRVTRKRDGGTKFPVYGGGGATFYLDDFNREDQMIVSRFAMSEECVRFVPGKFFLNDSGLTVRPRDELKMSQEFLDQQLLAKSSEIYSTARGAAQKNMDMTMFRSMELSFPDSLSEQKRIVALLDTATACVTELIACYEQARTHANNLFTSALRELMEEIDGTVEATLSDLCQVDWGNTNLTKKSYVERGDYLAVSAAGLDGRIGHAEHKAFTPVLSAIGARCGRMFLPDEDFTAIKNTITLTPKLDVASGKFIYFLFEHLSLPIRGAAQPFIAKGDIEKFEVAIPSLRRQEKIVKQLEMVQTKTSEMVAAYDAKLVSAKNLRQSVLEAAFAGEL